MHRHLVFLAAIFISAAPQSWAENDATGPAIEAPERARDLSALDRDAFLQLAEVAAAIDFQHLDYRLLDAAVFHETNRRRTTHGLAALGCLPGLREAARIQAQSMRREATVSHQHVEANLKELADRLAFLGLKAGFSAENAAMTFGIRYQSGKPFFPGVKDGLRVVSDQAAGPPIPAHSYRSFAESLLDQWMASPGHRQNIVSPESKSLGASCLHERTPGGMDQFYCVQVFYAPQE